VKLLTRALYVANRVEEASAGGTISLPTVGKVIIKCSEQPYYIIYYIVVKNKKTKEYENTHKIKLPFPLKKKK